MTLAFTTLSHDETPRGSAALNGVKQVGAHFGVTVIAVVLQGYTSANSGSQQILSAFNATFWRVFGLSAIPLFLAFFLPGRVDPGTGSWRQPAFTVTTLKCITQRNPRGVDRRRTSATRPPQGSSGQLLVKLRELLPFRRCARPPLGV